MSIIKNIIREKLKTALGLYSAYSSRDTRAVFLLRARIGVSLLSLRCGLVFIERRNR